MGQTGRPAAVWYTRLLIISCLYFHCCFVVQLLILQFAVVNVNGLPCEEQWRASEFDSEPPFITFIVPSSGRHSLATTLASLVNQTRQDWRAVVLFDGVVTSNLYLVNRNRSIEYDKKGSPQPRTTKATTATTAGGAGKESLLLLPSFLPQFDKLFADRRICYQFLSNHTGSSNCGGAIRNIGVAMSTSPWVGFVDDDDSVDSNYAQQVWEESAAYPNTTLILFRMYLNDRIIPHPQKKTFALNDVGISFATKRSLFVEEGYLFKNSNGEDYLFLHEVRRSNNHSIVLSNQIMYFVNNDIPTRQQRHQLLQASPKSILITEENTKEVADHLQMIKSQWDRIRHGDSASCARGAAGPTNRPIFRFNENERRHPVYGPLAEGLTANLEKAVKAQCLGRWTHKHKLPLRFSFSHPPVTGTGEEFYIYIQLSRDDDFANPLGTSNVVQIWKMSPPLSSKTYVGNVAANADESMHAYYVPTALMLPTSPPVHQCAAATTTATTPLRNISCGTTKSISNESNSDSNNNCGASSITVTSPLLTTVQPNSKFEIYRLGFYRTCAVDKYGTVRNGKLRVSSSCELISNNSSRSAEGAIETAVQGEIEYEHNSQSLLNATERTCRAYKNEPINFDKNECARVVNMTAPVLMYGRLEGSFNNMRERICDHLQHTISSGGKLMSKHEQSEEVLCLQTGGSGLTPVPPQTQASEKYWMNRFVCRARIIVLEHYHENSVLETHIVDPLLLAAKIVVTTPSADKHLQSMYEPFIHVSERKSLKHVINHLLRIHHHHIQQQQHQQVVAAAGGQGYNTTNDIDVRTERGRSFLTAQGDVLDPLCHAMRSLRVDIFSATQRRKKEAAIVAQGAGAVVAIAARTDGKNIESAGSTNTNTSSANL